MTPTDTLDTLRTASARTKAGRKAITAALIAIGERHGATVTTREEAPNPGWRGAGTTLTFTLAGVGALVSVNDLHERSGMRGSVLSWHNDYTDQQAGEGHFSEWRTYDFTPAFNCAVGDLGRYRPHHKATSIGEWHDIAHALDCGLELAASGRAFLPLDGEG